MARTPGRWEFGRFYYPDDGTIGTCEVTPHGEFATLATVYLTAKGRPAHGEGEANARLMAAAPELLASLREMIECYGSDDGGGPIPIIERARAAIAKATGGTA